MKVVGRKSIKKEKPVLIWQEREKELEIFVHMIMSQAKHINHRAKDYESEMLNETAEASSDFIVPLLRFQKEWLAWAFDQENNFKGGVLADDMGMGKTIQAIALVLAKRELQQNRFAFSQSPLVKGTLVICPVVAITQWVDEIDRCTLKGSTKVLVYHGAGRVKNRKQLSSMIL
ncbi:unnamed protein product [Vicia faba]|uniref:SNF2 N-terminal domain-containing protein n=1 Tax=Vicia faba TaxID=3906 RepID=A0AAV0YEQ9_VICFA|nr:unnamed protein product [Vicia faba]